MLECFHRGNGTIKQHDPPTRRKGKNSVMASKLKQETEQKHAPVFRWFLLLSGSHASPKDGKKIFTELKQEQNFNHHLGCCCLSQTGVRDMHVSMIICGKLPGKVGCLHRTSSMMSMTNRITHSVWDTWEDDIGFLLKQDRSHHKRYLKPAAHYSDCHTERWITAPGENSTLMPMNWWNHSLPGSSSSLLVKKDDPDRSRLPPFQSDHVLPCWEWEECYPINSVWARR